MFDEPSDDQMEEARELRALTDARSALEAVEREHSGIFTELNRWRQKYQRLEEGLREDALVFSFGQDGDLERVEGPIEERLGHPAQESVAGFEKFADEATASAVRDGVKKVLGGSAHHILQRVERPADHGVCGVERPSGVYGGPHFRVAFVFGAGYLAAECRVVVVGTSDAAMWGLHGEL